MRSDSRSFRFSFFLAAAAVFAAQAPVCGAAPKRRPSVLLIVMDAVRADRTSPYGQRGAATPALGGLAGRAVVFENAYANSNWTGSSFASILTGKRPFTNGMLGIWGFLPEEAKTIQSVLAGSGYETAAFVTGVPAEPHSGLSRGFGHISIGLGTDPASRQVAAALDWKKTLAPAKDYFILMHGNDAHWPGPCLTKAPPNTTGFPELGNALLHCYNALAADQGDCRKLLPFGGGPAMVSAISGAYDRCISELDDSIGALLRGLEADKDRPLLVLVTSDHGDLFGEHGLIGHGEALYEPLVRVPLIVSFPDGRGGRRVPGLAEHVDLLPTICKAAGVGCPGGLEGKDLSAMGTKGGEPRKWAAASFMGGEDERVVQTAAYSYGGKKIMLYRGRWQLFDLASDPGETRNIAEERPAEFLEMASGYLSFTGVRSLKKSAYCPDCSLPQPARPGTEDEARNKAADRKGFSVKLSGEKGLVCENAKGRPAAAPGCVGPANRLLNCIEKCRYADKFVNDPRERYMEEALRNAGYTP